VKEKSGTAGGSDNLVFAAAAGVGGANLIHKANKSASGQEVDADIAIRLGWEILGFRALKRPRVRFANFRLFLVDLGSQTVILIRSAGLGSD
jgi:hypothetical protein